MQLNSCSFGPKWIFFFCSFCARGLSCLHFLHHGTYVFQTAVLVRNEQKRDTDMYVNTDMFMYTYIFIYIFTYKNIFRCVYMCVCVCVCVCVFVFFVVWCRVMSCVARRCSLFFVCRSSLVVSCRLSFVVLCSVVLCSLRMPYPSPLCCLNCCLLAGSSGNSRWTSGARDNPVFFSLSLSLSLSLLLSFPSKTPPCVHSTRLRVCRHHAHMPVHTGTFLNVHTEAF